MHIIVHNLDFQFAWLVCTFLRNKGFSIYMIQHVDNNFQMLEQMVIKIKLIWNDKGKNKIIWLIADRIPPFDHTWTLILLEAMMSFSLIPHFSSYRSTCQMLQKDIFLKAWANPMFPARTKDFWVMINWINKWSNDLSCENVMRDFVRVCTSRTTNTHTLDLFLDNMISWWISLSFPPPHQKVIFHLLVIMYQNSSSS